MSFANAGSPPVFPGAQGFGTRTPAGRGGEVFRVTNLEPEGPGSFRDCAEAAGPRVCVFEISGTIVGDGDPIQIGSPYLTIAGQTAPSPGITLRETPLHVDTHDVLIQHIRVRVGRAAGRQADGISIVPFNGLTKNIVIDHVSVSWATDGNIDLFAQEDSKVRKVTISNSIIAEPLSGKGGIFGPPWSHSISSRRNVWAHARIRAPLIDGASNRIEVVNNLAYDYRNTPIFIFNDDDNGSVEVAAIGNVSIPGPASDGRMEDAVKAKISVLEGSVYVEDNICNGGGDCALGIGHLQPLSNPIRAPKKVLTAQSAIDVLLATAGARPNDRDDVDLRVIADIENGTGGLVFRESQVGGWPELDVNQRPLTLPVAPNADDDGNGYTNLEEWLHEFSAEVEGRN